MQEAPELDILGLDQLNGETSTPPLNNNSAFWDFRLKHIAFSTLGIPAYLFLLSKNRIFSDCAFSLKITFFALFDSGWSFLDTL